MKRLLLMFILLVVILVGCQHEDGQENMNDEAELDETDDIDAGQEENLDESTSKENEDMENDEINEDVENEETIEEEIVKEPLYKIEGIHDFVPIDDADPNVVLITIDDVPDQNGLEMAKTLKELDVPAIFFVNGHFINTEEKQEVLREIHDMGFTIGNHTYSHKNLQQISEEEQREEIIKLNDLIEEVIGEKPKFFRAPHGANTDYVKQIIKDEGMLLMNWTYGYDYFEPYMDKDKLTEAMVTGRGPEVGVDYSLLKPGANLLMHDRKWTSEALPHIIEGLRDQGYGFIDPDTILIQE